MVGSVGSDTLVGDIAANVIDGGYGLDTIDGDDGNDLVRGGPDADALAGGPATTTCAVRRATTRSTAAPTRDSCYGDDGVDTATAARPRSGSRRRSPLDDRRSPMSSSNGRARRAPAGRGSRSARRSWRVR